MCIVFYTWFTNWDFLGFFGISAIIVILIGQWMFLLYFKPIAKKKSIVRLNARQLFLDAESPTEKESSLMQTSLFGLS